MAVGLDHNRMRMFGAVRPRYGQLRGAYDTDPRNQYLTEQPPQEEQGQPSKEPEPPKPWWDSTAAVERLRQNYLMNTDQAMQMGVDGQIVSNPQLFDQFWKLQQQYLQKQNIDPDSMTPEQYQQALQQIDRQLSQDMLSGNVPPDMYTSAGLQPPAPPGGMQDQGPAGAPKAPPIGDTGPPTGPPDTTGTETGGPEPPAGGEEEPPPPDVTEWSETPSGQLGWSETNPHASEYNRWTNLLDYYNEWMAKPDKTEAFRHLADYFRDQGFARRWDDQKGWMFWVDQPNGTGGWYRLNRMHYILKDWQTDLFQKADQEQRYTEFFDNVQEWITGGYQYETSDITQEFESEWTQTVREVFGDIAGLPGASDYINTFLDMYPITEFTPEALPGTSEHERRALFFEKLKEQGIDIDDPERYQGDEGRQQFLNDLRDMALRLNPDTFFAVDDTSYEKLKQLEIGNLIQMIERKSTMTEAEIQKAVGQMMAPAERQAVRDLDRRLSAHAAAGRAYSGAVARSITDMQSQLQELRLGKTSEIFIQGIRDAEAGRISAIQQLGQIRQSDLTAMLEKAKLRGTLAADWLEHMAEIGRLTVEEERTDVHVWEVMGNQRLKVAELELSGQLELAGLDMEQYRVDVGYDTQRMITDLETAYRQQGLNLDAAKFKAQQVVNQWDAAATMANLAQRGDFDKLIAMADLALKAQQGDMDAWAEYQRLNLQEKLQQRGMDIDATKMIADVMLAMKLQKDQFDFEEWRTRYMAAHEKEMAELMKKLNKGSLWDVIAGLAPGLINLIPGLGGGGTTYNINIGGGATGAT